MTQRRPWSRGSVRLWLEVAVLHAGAACFAVAAWGVGFVALLGVSLAVRMAVVEPAVFDVPHGLDDIAPAGLEYGAAAFVLIGFLTAASALGRVGRRLRGVAADRAQEWRPRPLLLYLRAFEDDYRVLAAGGSETRAANELFSFRARVPYEEVVARELGRHGHVVAIAEPGTPRLFLPLGASRKRFSDQDWRDAIRAWMREAALIVIAVGSTEGLLYEVDSAASQEHFERVVLIVPPDNDEQIRARWNTSAATISATGGPVVEAPVDPATILVAQLGYTGVRRVIVADRRDEHTYVAAIRQALAARGGV